jgi:hypothetical protein
MCMLLYVEEILDLELQENCQPTNTSFSFVQHSKLLLLLFICSFLRQYLPMQPSVVSNSNSPASAS